MNLPESLPSSGTPDLAALAAKSAVLRRAASLAGWAGGGKRTLTAKGVLRRQDVPAAAAIIGVKAPQAVRSAADLPELHVAWCAAIGMGLLTVEGGKASGGPELKSWPPDDGTGLLEAWLKGFFAVSAVLGGGDRDLGRDFLVLEPQWPGGWAAARRPTRWSWSRRRPGGVRCGGRRDAGLPAVGGSRRSGSGHSPMTVLMQTELSYSARLGA